MTMFQNIYIYIYIKSQKLRLKGFVALFQEKKKKKVKSWTSNHGFLNVCVFTKMPL